MNISRTLSTRLSVLTVVLTLRLLRSPSCVCARAWVVGVGSASVSERLRAVSSAGAETVVGAGGW